MCGILGTVNIDFNKEILDLLKHRGPDDWGIEEVKYENFFVKFGHRRLSILDLSPKGHQPMYSYDKNFLIVYNGEIYNHLELRKNIKNIPFCGHSDTETVINYISLFGIDSVKNFNGIFAFSVLNIKNQKIYLVRDRFGVKPLYYYINSNKFIFSSELRPIKKLINTKLNLKNLATLLKLRYLPAPLTLYENVFKLRPGHILEYNLITTQMKIYPFISPVGVNTRIKFKEALEIYGNFFAQAIKKQLLSDVEIGILLSGGIDSALVAYFAQKYSNKPIKTFTVGFFEKDEANEIEEASVTSKIIGTEHYDVKITEHDFEKIFEKCVMIVEEPLGTTSIIPMYYLSRLVSKYLKEVLTGQGADEPLGGYTRYLGEMFISKLPNSLLRLIKPFSSFIKNESFHRLIMVNGKDIIKRFEQIYALFYDNEIINLIGIKDNQSYELIKYFYDLLEGYRKDNVNAMLSNDLRMNLPDDLLLYTDKITMHFSVEARVPILDNHLVEFLESLPIEYKIKFWQKKYIHKKFAEKILPKRIVYRSKKGFKSPTKKWLKGQKGYYFKLLLTDLKSKFSNVFDPKAVSRIFDLHFSGKRNMERQLFTLISLYFWFENE